MTRPVTRPGRLAAVLLLAALPGLRAADERVVPASLSGPQRENLLKFLKDNETPDRYVPKGARFGDDPPPNTAFEIAATKEKPIKQYTVQITPHRPVPDMPEVKQADVYFYRPNPEKGKPGIAVKFTVDLTTGVPVGEPEVLTKAHTPVSREELAEAVAMVKEKSEPVKKLYAGREDGAVRFEYLQMKINRKSEQFEPGDRVVRFVFQAAPLAEGEAAPAPVRVIVNLTRDTIIPDDR
jgi:hypothetical protein